jgi:hypothetical protein
VEVTCSSRSQTCRKEKAERGESERRKKIRVHRVPGDFVDRSAQADSGAVQVTVG